MTQGILSLLLDNYGECLYRELIQVYVKKQSASELQQSILEKTSNLPEKLQDPTMKCIDLMDEIFCDDKDFWREATCLQAFISILVIAVELLPVRDRISSMDDVFKPENQELFFQVFQILTLSFAYSASKKRAKRKFMGIRKSLFGESFIG
jgi:hypothetical protein